MGGGPRGGAPPLLALVPKRSEGDLEESLLKLRLTRGAAQPYAPTGNAAASAQHLSSRGLLPRLPEVSRRSRSASERSRGAPEAGVEAHVTALLPPPRRGSCAARGGSCAAHQQVHHPAKRRRWMEGAWGESCEETPVETSPALATPKEPQASTPVPQAQASAPVPQAQASTPVPTTPETPSTPASKIAKTPKTPNPFLKVAQQAKPTQRPLTPPGLAPPPKGLVLSKPTAAIAEPPIPPSAQPMSVDAHTKALAENTKALAAVGELLKEVLVALRAAQPQS